MSPQDNRITISGGTFRGSAVANQNATVHSGSGNQVDLRALLADARRDIVEDRRADVDVADVERRLDDLDAELAEDADADVVRGGWKSVLRLLAGGAAATESVAAISEHIRTVFGG